MIKKKLSVTQLLKELKVLYPKHIIPLRHHNAWELLCAVILSAQCTDARVNTITPHLFKKYPTVQDLANASVKDVEKIIHSAGFYHSKALSLVEMSKRICEVYDGQVPQSIANATRRGAKNGQRNVGRLFQETGRDSSRYACETVGISVGTYQTNRSGKS